MLSEENLREIRHNLAHLSLPAVRDFYEQAYRDCRLVYNHLPSARQIQTLVQDAQSSKSPSIHSPERGTTGSEQTWQPAGAHAFATHCSLNVAS